MQFLTFVVPYAGDGMTIALNAIVHVLVSHGVAIGVVGLIVLSEHLGLQDSAWEEFAKRLIKPAVIVVTGVGAVTGVGIWFTTSTLAPGAIASLLRVFFWPWFFEWLVFTAEVIVILVYYFTWNAWTGKAKRRHIVVGYLYVVLALVSAFLITGILGFMLTSDGWPWHESFWSAFFNPSFFPQLALRIGGGIFLGVIFVTGFLLFSRQDPVFRRRALRLLGAVGLISFAITGASALWYFHAVPSTFKEFAVFSVLTQHLSQYPKLFWYGNAAAALLLLVFVVSALRGTVGATRALVAVCMVLAIGFVSEFERIREFIRGPYLIPGYMYVHQMLLTEPPYYRKHGLLKNSYWYTAPTEGRSSVVSEGAYLFGRNCSVCHTIGGLNDIRDRLRGRSRDGVYALIGNTHRMVPFMPPFAGTDRELRTMGYFLYEITHAHVLNGSPSRFTVVRPGGRHE